MANPTLEYRLLSDSEISDLLSELPGWSNEAGKLVKLFPFKTYKDGLVFGVAIGYLADKMEHHPDLEIGYAKVKIGVNTHDVGGISPYDIELVRQIEALP